MYLSFNETRNHGAMTILEQMNSRVTPGSVWDKSELNSVKGLHLRVLPSGRRAFYFSYTTKSGVQRRPKIGDVPGTKLSEARDRARMLSSRIAIGEDPKGQWDQSKAEATVYEAFLDIATNYWNSPRFNRSGRHDEVSRLYFKMIEKPMGASKLSDVTFQQVRMWHASTGFGSPTYANRALEVLSKIFSYQIEKGWPGVNPCKGVKANPEKKRKRFATPEELKLIGEKLNERLNRGGYSTSGALFILALAYTGARPKSLEIANWNDLAIDPEKGHGIYTFHGKSSADSGEDETVVFPKQLVDILAARPRLKSGKIFASHACWRSVWNQIRYEVGCTDLWARDLRRTFASVGLSSGVSIGAIGETLNHKSAQTTKVYAKIFDEAKIESATTIADKMQELMSASSSVDSISGVLHSSEKSV